MAPIVCEHANSPTEMGVLPVYRLSPARANRDFSPVDRSNPYTEPNRAHAGFVTASTRLPPPLLVAILVVIAVLSATRASAGSEWEWPIVGPVVRAFERPATPWGPGHRGIDVQSVEGAVVRAPVAGRVTFAGDVAGRGVVVLRTLEDEDITLEPVEPTVVRKDVVAAGDPVGLIVGVHEGIVALHLGIRVRGEYVDPLPYLPPAPRIVVYRSRIESYSGG